MAPLILTLVRHGESVDNCKNTWAGHLDSTLSNHGNNQAQRLGSHFATHPIDAIYTSDLLRARMTADSVRTQNEAESLNNGETKVIPFNVDELLREQWFGAAEGSRWDAGQYASIGVDWEGRRSFRLAPDAECLDDIAVRVDQAIAKYIYPHVLSSAASDTSENVMLFAHGIFLSEMLYGLKRSEDPSLTFAKGAGYTNTGFTKLEISLLPGKAAFKVKILAFNQVEHLEGLTKQKGGIGSLGFDPNQKKIQDFFGGKSA